MQADTMLYCSSLIPRPCPQLPVMASYGKLGAGPVRSRDGKLGAGPRDKANIVVP